MYCLALENGKDRLSRNVGKITTNVYYATSQKHEYLSETLPVTNSTLHGLELHLCFRVASPKTNLTSRAMARSSVNSFFPKSANLSYMCRYCTLRHHVYALNSNHSTLGTKRMFARKSLYKTVKQFAFGLLLVLFFTVFRQFLPKF